MTDIGTIEILHSQHELWRSGRLAPEWARRFPELFDAQDLRLAETQGPLGYHFVEWLAAIVLYHTTGYLSLVQKYEFPVHRRKHEIVQKLLPADVLPILSDRAEHGRAQSPDLHRPSATRTDGKVRGPRKSERKAGPPPTPQMGA